MTTYKPAPQPIEIEKRKDGQIRILWADGHEGIYPPIYLRAKCHCASCVEEWTGRRIIQEAQLPKDLRPLGINAVGTYAVQIEWSDGHNTGIYPFDLLRDICPCGQCLPEGIPQP